jgi:hypothetical protein
MNCGKKGEPMAKDTTQISFRLPKSLLKRIKEAAGEGKGSVSGEICQRLAVSFEQSKSHNNVDYETQQLLDAIVLVARSMAAEKMSYQDRWGVFEVAVISLLERIADEITASSDNPGNLRAAWSPKNDDPITAAGKALAASAYAQVRGKSK